MGAIDQLAHTRRGAGRRLVLVHGFTQTGRSWDVVAPRLATSHEVVAVDAPGHGDSGALLTDLPGGAELLGATSGRATYVGYSMGGRLALHLAVARPGLVDGLVLIGATAGIEDDAQRAARRTADVQLAASIERDGVAPFLDRWLAQPLLAGLPHRADDRADRLRNTAAGLAASLRLAGTGTQEPLWDRLVELTMPVLLVTGELDTKFTAIAERMAASLPRATLAVVPDAGHTVHVERPDAFVDVLERWLADHPPSASPAVASAP
jgi:2-succinyl-6-hydroxy-2,4-cyclohexadiene-1-carboxylate synthase